MIQGRVMFVDDEDMLADVVGRRPTLYDLKPDIVSASAEFDLVIYQGRRSRNVEFVLKSRMGAVGHIEPPRTGVKTISPGLFVAETAMNVIPEIVKDRLVRFYIVFGMPSEGESREFNREVQIWTEHFQHVPAAAFEMACFHCEGSLTSFPCIADVAGKIPSLSQDAAE